VNRNMPVAGVARSFYEFTEVKSLPLDFCICFLLYRFTLNRQLRVVSVCSCRVRSISHHHLLSARSFRAAPRLRDALGSPNWVETRPFYENGLLRTRAGRGRVSDNMSLRFLECGLRFLVVFAARYAGSGFMVAPFGISPCAT
jgi:hypothetical protein